MRLPYHFGRYTLLEKIACGGTAEVYRAVLNAEEGFAKTVAVKRLLPAWCGSDDFERMLIDEGRVLTHLTHGAIVQVMELGRIEGMPFLAMEFVDGIDAARLLSELIRDREPLPPPHALYLIGQVLLALAFAHRAAGGDGRPLNIVHRDVSPSNILLSWNGEVKVTDFGIAKGLHRSRETRVGQLKGKYAYMAPEQARGRVVDRRANIWAFGVVVYEMLMGRRLFDAEDISETLAAVLTREVSVTSMPADIPPRLRALVRDCLIRDPKQRLRDIGDARLVLDKIIAGALDDATTPAPFLTVAPMWQRALPWALAAALAVALVAALAEKFGPPPNGVPLRRFAIEIPSKSAPNWNDFNVVISPDGTQVAYNCREGNTVNLCVRALDSLTARRVSEGRDAEDWFFSPDGEWIGIKDEVGLSKVSIRGGQPQTIYRWADTERPGIGFAWTADDHILFGTRAGIQRVAASGGAPEPVTRIATGSGVAAHMHPSLLPGGRSGLITIVHTDGSHTGGMVNLNDGSVRDLGIRGDRFFFLIPGWLAFQQGTTVLAAAFDPGSPGRLANPVPVLENVGTIHGVARDGTLVYIPTRGESSARLVWVDRAGRPTPVAGERLDYTHLDLAPDGRRALLNLESGQIDLIDLERGTRKLLSPGGMPIWSSNGERATFRNAGVGLQWMLADGSAQAEVLVSEEGYLVPTSWNAATGDLAYYDHRAFEIWIRSPDGKTRRFLGGAGRKRSGRFSPDGKWMAFVSDETGAYQVYVTAYPGPGPTVAVSTKGGLSPIWSANGRELFFRLGSKVMAAAMSSTASLGFNVPIELFDGPYTLDLKGHQREDVAPDGRFLLVENSDDFPIVIVQNWAAELSRVVR